MSFWKGDKQQQHQWLKAFVVRNDPGSQLQDHVDEKVRKMLVNTVIKAISNCLTLCGAVVGACSLIE